MTDAKQSNTTLAAMPAYVGLCPGEHLNEFCMPLDRLDPWGERCPECDELLVLYRRPRSRT